MLGETHKIKLSRSLCIIYLSTLTSLIIEIQVHSSIGKSLGQLQATKRNINAVLPFMLQQRSLNAFPLFDTPNYIYDTNQG
jgi:hypothetical protein